MLSQELLSQIRLIEITTRRIVDEVLSGQYRSQFKGQGVQFSEHRLYVPGDDVRHINWNVSARTKEPLIKKFEEERELTVFLVVDVSGSKDFGSYSKLKSEIAAEVGGMLAYAAIHSGDRVGGLLFAGEVEHFIPVKKSRQHVFRIIHDLLSFQPKTQGTNLSLALDSVGRVMKHKGIIFVISDFLVSGYENSLKRLAKKHEVVAISISDERETIIPDCGQLLFLDPETGIESFVDTSSYAFKSWFQQSQKARDTELKSKFRGSRIETLKLLTKEDYGEAVVRFFRARTRR